MLAVTVSPKFQVVIPRQARERMGLQAGTRLQVISYDARIELLPVEPATHLRGFLSGMDSTVERDEDRV